jgi:hydrogenase maturation protease
VTIAPILVLAIGNPSRGDDALGPAALRALGDALAVEIAAGQVELMTDFQLQPEHALDLVGRRWVLFIDASVAAPPPFTLEPVVAGPDASVSSHALSPAAVLEVMTRLRLEVPPAEVLAIRGVEFELGVGMSAEATAHLAAAIAAIVPHLRRQI